MSIKQAQATCRDMGMTLRKVDDEFQVKDRSWKWNHGGVYHTNDLQDAVSTAQRMSEELSIDAPISAETFIATLRKHVDEFERVRDLPGGYTARSFIDWFKHFEEDVFAPEGP